MHLPCLYIQHKTEQTKVASNISVFSPMHGLILVLNTINVKVVRHNVSQVIRLLLVTDFRFILVVRISEEYFHFIQLLYENISVVYTAHRR